ncbi:hypothetical protein OG455_02020 [Kitasatospora sp. NBC_01287]|uniref:alpha/beta fold hydrolase n=1 Tax=Kitasatospora sp. NBC_01287 TaxID=2903573 RepID=UPI00225478F5|nr:hypothetical protein [Kitasatospora sp. NBC_01287]MCX4744301.1 hypothetical protein [Kitasatospora sp. NBC_01287]
MGGIRLAYQLSGPPDAPPLVLLQALGEGAADWREVTPVLARGRRVYALDLRGDPAWLERLGEITARTLVLAGGPSSHVAQEGIAELAGRLPDGRVVTIPVGHLIHHAAPGEFLAAVSPFLLADGEFGPGS